MAFADAFGETDLHVGKDVARGRGAGTKGARLFDLLRQFNAGSSLASACRQGADRRPRQMRTLFLQQLGQPRHRGVQLVFGHRQARGHFVTAALYQQPLGGQPLDRRAQINARDRPARPFADAISNPITTAGRLALLSGARQQFPRRRDASPHRGPDQRRVRAAFLGLLQRCGAHGVPRHRGVRCSARRAVLPGLRPRAGRRWPAAARPDRPGRCARLR